MQVFRDTWRRERRERPLAARSALVGVGTLTAAAVLAGGSLYLIAELVAGLALVPLALATYLRMLPSSPWTDGRGDGGGPGRGGDDDPGPGPSGDPDAHVDWDRFEREFRAYAEERQLVQV
jgi:hypothetical protein